MIEINLIPDVKQELIRAKRVRNTVISGAVVVGIGSLAAVVILAVISFGVQPLASKLADNDIDKKYAELQKVPDLGNMLTIQGQLASISDLHDSKTIASRLFELLVAINPSKENEVTYSQVQLNVENKTIRIDAQAKNGFAAAEAFEKTVKATNMSYTIDGETTKEPVADDVTQGDQSLGEDSNGAKVLRFSLTLTYNDALFSRKSTKLSIVQPDRQDATDSYRRVPESLFSARASDTGGSQ